MERRIKRSKSFCDKYKLLNSHVNFNKVLWLIALASVFGYIMSSQGMPFDPSLKRNMYKFLWTSKLTEVEFRMMIFLSLLSSTEHNMTFEQRNTEVN